jgi:hypothetical protein
VGNALAVEVDVGFLDDGDIIELGHVLFPKNA